MKDALALYRALVDMGARPALTWYSSQGRMELSGAVVANHCAKIAGFLGEEAWVDAGEQARLDLPCHWKSVLWALGAMLAGLHVEIDGDGAISDDASGDGGDEVGGKDETQAAVLITNHPEREEARSCAREVVALDMNPLVFGWTGEQLPDGVLDGSAGQLAHPDVLVDTQRHVSSNFEQWASGKLSEEERALFVSTSFSEVLRCVCLQFLRGGSLVVAPAGFGVPDTEGATPVTLTV
ncbi:MAG: hypothetical protein IKZ87_00060 [Actinomycetaceae bacterium]|nr:hypothetical protein [Actinomycetaceae bacterium]